MIEFPRDPQNTIPSSSVKIVGLGGAGTNMLDRVVLDGMDGAEMLAINTDIRTLSGSVARDRIQLGRNLTKGLGAGGDPELGQQAVLEAEAEIRGALKGRKIVFLCVGLGGGTGSGAAPIVCRIAREEGAFVVVFATMPFSFEGRRRREQADTSLNELAVLSNALVTFDNTRMGDLVLAKQGIHEAFAAADRMISESIKAVIRLVIRPGLINVGLDDLMTALRTTRSRCLFGSGIAAGKDRAQKALRNALNSPLLDQGALLKDAESVLVHLCGGEDLTLYEIELLMQSLSKHVPDKAHVLFGAAVDPSMGEHLSITMVSSLPEDRLHMPRTSSMERPALLEPTVGFADELEEELEAEPEPEPAPVAIRPAPSREKKSAVAPAAMAASLFADPAPGPVVAEFTSRAPEPAPAPAPQAKSKPQAQAPVKEEAPFAEPEAEPSPFTIDQNIPQAEVEEDDFASFMEEEEAEAEVPAAASAPVMEEEEEEEPFVSIEEEEEEEPPLVVTPTSSAPAPAAKSAQPAPAAAAAAAAQSQNPVVLPGVFDDLEEAFAELEEDRSAAEAPAAPRGKSASGKSQGELSFEGGPRGKFEGASSGLFEGEDLDVPAFLRKKR